MTGRPAAPSVSPASSPPRADPARVLGSLGLASLAILVLLNTVFTSPDLLRALQFDPARPFDRPWALFTYPFVHTGLAHLLGVGVLIALLGPDLVRRMGNRTFLAYLAACAGSAAILGIALSAFFHVPTLSGGLALGYGIALARGWLADEEEVALDPVPRRARVRTLIALGVAGLVVVGLIARTPALSVAHAGGLLAGLLWFRIRAAGRPPITASALPARRAVMTPVRLEVKESSSGSAPRNPPSAPSPGPPPPDRGAAGSDSDELDRLLDKISEQGFESLTEQERRSLAELAERKRKPAED